MTGDDVLAQRARRRPGASRRRGEPRRDLGDRIVSANAYLGARPIAEALAHGADVVITGRVADPSLFVAPLIHAFGWALDDWHRLGAGDARRASARMCRPGHRRLLRRSRLQGRARISPGSAFPIAEVERGRHGRHHQAGGHRRPRHAPRPARSSCSTRSTIRPRYLTPDVVADFSQRPRRGDRAGPRARRGRRAARPAPAR